MQKLFIASAGLTGVLYHLLHNCTLLGGFAFISGWALIFSSA